MNLHIGWSEVIDILRRKIVIVKLQQRVGYAQIYSLIGRNHFRRRSQIERYQPLLLVRGVVIGLRPQAAQAFPKANLPSGIAFIQASKNDDQDVGFLEPVLQLCPEVLAKLP